MQSAKRLLEYSGALLSAVIAAFLSALLGGTFVYGLLSGDIANAFVLPFLVIVGVQFTFPAAFFLARWWLLLGAAILVAGDVFCRSAGLTGRWSYRGLGALAGLPMALGVLMGFAAPISWSTGATPLLGQLSMLWAGALVGGVIGAQTFRGSLRLLRFLPDAR